MKKIIAIMLACILVVGCTNKKPYIEINYKEFLNKIESKESFILYIGTSTCKFCKKYEKALTRVINDYDVEVFYINVGEGKLTDEEYKNFNDLTNFGGSTPVTIFAKEGEVQGQYNRIVGAVETGKIINSFIKNEYIEKK